MKHWRTPLAAALFAPLVFGLAILDARPDETFTLQDHLGRDWHNECVRFTLSPAQAQHVAAGHALVAPGGAEIAYQSISGATNSNRRIAFLVDLPAFASRAFTFAAQPAKAPTDITIRETPDRIEVVNKLTGIAIRKTLAGSQGPIAGIRLPSAGWVGDSRLTGAESPDTYTCAVAASGPVFVDLVCDAAWTNGATWQLHIRLHAAEPAVLVEERFDANRTDAVFALSLKPNLDPNQILYRWSHSAKDGGYGKLTTWKLDGRTNPAFHLEPWVRWYAGDRRYNWLGLLADRADELLMVGVLRPGVWVDPVRHAAGTQLPPRVFLNQRDGDLVTDFPIRGVGERHWMLGVLDKAACLAPLRQEPPVLYKAPLPHQLLVKHGDFPLDMVKDYILEWKQPARTRPELFLNEARVATFRQTFQSDSAELQRLRTSPIHYHQLEKPIRYLLGTGDEALADHVAATAVEWSQRAVDMYLHQDDLITLGFAPHHQTRVLGAVTLADVALSTGRLSPELTRRLLAQFAFIGYTVMRPDYWDPARGFAANPNMTTTVNAYKCAIGCLLSTHPRAAHWVASAMKELKAVELDTWSDANGGWLEAPHYAMVSYDYLAGCFLMTHNAGFNDYLFDPKMKKVIEWMAKICTPPDARINRIRHRPPIGNTYLSEPTSMFGLMAGLWREHDPEFSANMQWMHQQGGAYSEPGIGGFFPTLAGYRGLLRDPSLPARPPRWESEWFPRTGVILRNGFPHERETQLHLIAGPNHAHYDRDSGSITLWGKGRIVADDFGYYGCAPADDHSLIESPIAGSGVMDVYAFEPSPRFDYVSGVKQGWRRQIAFVKDPDPMAPAYFIVADALAAPGPSTWRLWLTASNVTITAHGALVTGKEDVDTDIFFLGPERPALRTEDKTRRCGSGFRKDGGWGPADSTQTGLIADLGKHTRVTAVLYPRLRTEAPPEFTTLAGGKAVKVVTPTGRDYVFLSAEPFSFEEGNIRFEGTAGCVQMRGGPPVLSLGAPGKLAVGNQSVVTENVVAP